MMPTSHTMPKYAALALGIVQVVIVFWALAAVFRANSRARSRDDRRR